MRVPIVCSSPPGHLWLLLEGGVYGPGKWLNLETGEVRPKLRPLNELLNWGWRLVEGDLTLEAI